MKNQCFTIWFRTCIGWVREVTRYVHVGTGVSAHRTGRGCPGVHGDGDCSSGNREDSVLPLPGYLPGDADHERWKASLTGGLMAGKNIAVFGIYQNQASAE